MSYKFLIYVAVMAGVTYLKRMIPLVLFKKEIKNTFIRSFLYYVPYAVLGAMTFPAILYSTNSVISASVGLAAAITTAFFSKKLLTVSLTACAAVFLCERLIELL